MGKKSGNVGKIKICVFFFTLCTNFSTCREKKIRRRKILKFFLDTAGSINCVPVDLYDHPSTLEHSTMPSDPLHSRPKYEGFTLETVHTPADPIIWEMILKNFIKIDYEVTRSSIAGGTCYCGMR